jgi:hypothetical protein
MKMVATNIEFNNEKREYKIGEVITVTMYPASLPDLKTFLKYKETQRTVVMDVFSSGNPDMIYSKKGESTLDAKKEAKYTFNLPVNPSFDSVGSHVVSFRYETTYGESITLENYDAAADELYDDSVQLNYTVKADLQLTDIKNPVKAGDLKYGNNINFSFKVKDTVSGKFLNPGSETSTVYLLLSHSEGKDKVLVSNRSPAKFEEQRFVIDWVVNPNAIKGKGSLELVAMSANKDIPLKDNNKPWKVNVDIGGEITFENKYFSGEMDDTYTAFHIQFTLACQKVKLTGANLFATISKKTTSEKGAIISELVSVPVTYGSTPGSYQVSWKLENTQTHTGTYTVDFYREVDVTKKSKEGTSKPFFTIDVEHEKKLEDGGMFPTEFFCFSNISSLIWLFELYKNEYRRDKKK